MNDETARQAIESYMAAFNSQDMESLGKVLADDASLTDWAVSAVGKEDVLATTKHIVSGARLHITVRRLVVELPFVAADLGVRVNDELELDVLDLFEFNEKGFIKSVRAFKGPERSI